MNEHLSIETISALLDGEVEESERPALEEHLASCDECSVNRSRLERGMRAVLALPAVEPTHDQSRALRRAVTEATRRKSRFTRTRLMWGAIAGAAALIAVGVFGFAATSVFRQERTASEPAAGRALSAANAGPSDFESDSQLKEAMWSDPQVREGVTRYRVKDVGNQQRELLASFESAESAGRAADAAAPAQEGDPTKTLATCLRELLRGQPYPLMPIVARRATYQGKPSYLLVYAFTVSADDENARLNLAQIWMVNRVDCGILNVQQLDPSKPLPK